VSALRDIQPSRGYVPNRSGPLDVRSAVNFEPDQASLAVLAEFGHNEDAAELSELLLACTASAETPITSDPLTYKEAMASPQAAEWQVAMESEMASLRAAGTYTLTECPAGQVPIGCKWVYATKRDAAGNVVKHKARLVAKGYSQRYGIDYEETYAPVCRIGSIRVLIALAAHFNWEIHHMDVTSAYLNGDLQETVYMQQPTGFEATGAQASLVCKLAKSLYGLKQAGRTWNQKIDDVLRSSGFTPLDADHCVYRSEKGFSHIIVSLYVDDLLLFSNDLRALTAFKAAVSTRFDMKDLGEAKFVLGMEIIRDRAQRSIALSQASYTREMLRTHTMVACNAADTPVQTGVRLAPPAEGFKANPTAIRTYQAAVGALMFAAICTRPDIAFAVGQLSQYASNPDKSHFSALTQCFRYLRGTIEYRLSYKGTGRVQDAPTVVGYSDADWAGDLGQRRSTTGYTFLLCGAAVSWQSKRQRTIA
jgi:Reverse transcriptase (RNA-dependent DNA polymerase)